MNPPTDWKEKLNQLSLDIHEGRAEWVDVETLIESEISKAKREEREIAFKGLDEIEARLDKLIDVGDVKCSLPECGDTECAAGVIRNAIYDTRKSLASLEEDKEPNV